MDPKITETVKSEKVYPKLDNTHFPNTVFVMICKFT